MLAIPVIALGTSAHATTAQEPCDIYAADGHPCVAANSTTRALFANYNGPLYTVTRDFDGKSLVINTATTGGTADVAAQDAFCDGTTCRITDIADQTPYNNDLIPGSAGGNGGADDAAIANILPVTVEGNKAYGVDVTPGVGYMDDNTSHIPTGSQPQGVYMVTSGRNYNNGCCFDYGNAETNRQDNGDGHMEAISYGGGGIIGSDMENGIWGLSNPITSDFVTAMVRSNNTTSYIVSGANADSGTLTSVTLPLTGTYSPMHLEGGMVLGTGGDNSKTASGDFYEGVITQGQPTATAQAAVQANIVSAGYTYTHVGGAAPVVASPTPPSTSPTTPPPTTTPTPPVTTTPPPAKVSNPYTPVSVDGNFAGNTVKATQWVDGSTTDGQFGPLSAGDMQRHLGRTVTHTLSTSDIKALQAHIGLTGSQVDGAWGPITTRALQTALNAGKY